VRRVKRLQHLEVLKVAARSACKSFFLKDFKVVEKLRKDRPLNLLKDSAGKLCLEGW
jgi:hypothetical protein